MSKVDQPRESSKLLYGFLPSVVTSAANPEAPRKSCARSPPECPPTASSRRPFLHPFQDIPHRPTAIEQMLFAATVREGAATGPSRTRPKSGQLKECDGSIDGMTAVLICNSSGRQPSRLTIACRFRPVASPRQSCSRKIGRSRKSATARCRWRIAFRSASEPTRQNIVTLPRVGHTLVRRGFAKQVQTQRKVFLVG